MNDDIEWTGGIGVTDWPDVCQHRRIWWIRLENGQVAQIADVAIYCNPFPRRGKTHYQGHRCRVHAPGVRSPREVALLAEAVFAAGQWCGEMIERDKHVPRPAPEQQEAEPCNASFEPANGEAVSPCTLPKGHSGEHRGTCLGHVCRWPQGYDSEYMLEQEDDE